MGLECVNIKQHCIGSQQLVVHRKWAPGFANFAGWHLGVREIAPGTWKTWTATFGRRHDQIAIVSEPGKQALARVLAKFVDVANLTIGQLQPYGFPEKFQCCWLRVKLGKGEHARNTLAFFERVECSAISGSFLQPFRQI